MAVLDSDVLADARARLGALFGYTFDQVEPIVRGRNNRLYRLSAADGPAVLLKKYVRDDRRRLQREFGALWFLRKQVGTLVPAAILADPDRNYAIYSFESGAAKPAGDLSLAEVEAMARGAAALHAISPDSAGCPDFPPAIAAAFSIEQTLRLIADRLVRFEAAAPTSRDADVRAFAARIPVRALIGELIARAVGILPTVARSRVLPREEWRLSNADFATHNLLVRPDGNVCSVDWEYAGWDDPARLVAGFLAHVRSLSISSEHAQRFLRTYAEVRCLPEAELARIAGLRLLHEVEWAAIHLDGMTEARLQRFLHARPEEDTHVYFAEQIEDFESRVARVRELLG